MVRQQQQQHDDGNDPGYGAARRYCTCTDGSNVGKCSDGNCNYFAINLHTMAMAVAITVAMAAPAAEAVAL